LAKKEFIKILDKAGFDRLRVKLDINKGKVIDVVFQYETEIDGKWKPIVRYDCAHGYFHKDIISPNGSQEKQLISIKNLLDASSYAEQDIKDRWEWYKEKYFKKLKK